jgi:hypothetical protein
VSYSREKGRHAAIVRELDIPVPFDVGEFAARLGRQRQRPIRLIPFTSAPGTLCGLWVSTADADYVYHEEGTTPFHISCIVLHEVSHMLLGHYGPPDQQDLASLVAPAVDPSLARLILGRSAYTTPQEREAETLASRILDRATVWPGSSSRFGFPEGQFARTAA